MKDQKSEEIVQKLKTNFQENRYFPSVVVPTETDPIEVKVDDEISVKTSNGEITTGKIQFIGQVGRDPDPKDKKLFFVLQLPPGFKPNVVARSVKAYMSHCIRNNIKIK